MRDDGDKVGTVCEQRMILLFALKSLGLLYYSEGSGVAKKALYFIFRLGLLLLASPLSLTHSLSHSHALSHHARKDLAFGT